MGPEPVSPALPMVAMKAGGHAELQEAARAFEGLMLERILATARPSASGPLGDAHALAERALASQLAGQDLFGLARLLESGK